MKKFALILVFVLALVCLISCGKKDEDGDVTGTNTGTTNAATAAVTSKKKSGLAKAHYVSDEEYCIGSVKDGTFIEQAQFVTEMTLYRKFKTADLSVHMDRTSDEFDLSGVPCCVRLIFTATYKAGGEDGSQAEERQFKYVTDTYITFPQDGSASDTFDIASDTVDLAEAKKGAPDFAEWVSFDVTALLFRDCEEGQEPAEDEQIADSRISVPYSDVKGLDGLIDG